MMDRDEPRNSGVLAAKPNGRRNSTLPSPNRLSSEKLSVSTPDFKENSSVVSDPDSTPSGRSSKASQRGSTHRPSLIARPSLSPRPSPSPSPRFNRSVSNSFNPGASKSPQSPRDTRIPRPKSTIPTSTPTTTPTLVKRNTPVHRNSSQKGPTSEEMRQPMDMKAAFKLAQEQEPRSQPHSRPESSLSMRQAYNMAAAEANGRHGIDGSPSPAPRTDRRDSSIPRPKSTLSGRHSDLGHHLQQFDRTHSLTGGGGALNGLFSKIRGGAKTADGNRAVSRKTSTSSIGSRPESRRTSFWGLSPRNKENSKSAGTTPKNRAVSRASSEAAIEDLRVPSLDYESASEGRSSPMITPTHPSPDKSYNWHLDADFTAGDLQVSESPRVRIDKPGGESNGATPEKSDKSGKSDKSDRPSSPPAGTPYFRRINIRLEQIKEREAKAAAEAASNAPKRGNSKLDEIRAREMEAESKKALAWSRLYDIRVQNGEARSQSPEASKSPKEDLRGGPLHFNKRRSMGGSMEHNKSERPEIARSHPEPKVKEEMPSDAASHRSNDNKSVEAPEAKVDIPQPRDEDKHEPLDNDSHDLLRRLARATSSSPLVETTEKTEKNERLTRSEELPPKGTFEPRNSSRRRHTTWEGRRSRNLDSKSSGEKPTVEFVGLRKVKSNDSIREKQGSRPMSEIDPTDRIEAEMNLFSVDNPSERNSKRAISPIPTETEPEQEDTPRPPKVDPRTLPTPRITGAYFDTPLTVKMMEKENFLKEGDPLGLEQAADILPGAHGRNSSWSHAKHDAGRAARDRTKTSDRPKPRSSSAPTNSRRARSRSRSRRRRPLINTAKPASVKDDIRAILRMNQIDDSTLEDFDSILSKHEIDDEELEKMVNDSAFKAEEDLDFTNMTDRERELEAYDRMSKTLKTGLLGIRSAKRGIERLEDKVTHAELKEDQASGSVNTSNSKVVVRTASKQAKPTAFTVKIPPLYHRSPQFKFTPFGLLTFIVAIWYALESAFCYMYASPQYECTPTMPCDWSPNEPYFPYTMPFMLDEWATGGKGRAVAWRVGEEVGDVVADISDWVTNTDFTQFDQKYMNVWERKRHRRRLRKHGMIPKWTEPPNYKPKFPAWNAARMAREEAEDFGYAADYEMMSADKRVR